MSAAKVLTISIPQVPPNWSNLRLHHIELYRRKRAWVEVAYVLAHKARVEAGWPRAAATDTQRSVTFTIHKTWPAFDPDGAWAAIKPILDGLKQTLIWDDGGEYIRIPSVDQVRVRHLKEQKTVITVTES